LPEDAIDRTAADQKAPSEVLDARKARAVLENILRGLPDQKREVFVLHVIEELSMQEVADALECPLHTAYSRFYAARKLVDDGIRRARAQMERP
jgi:RNA polymerase sigma-70 factor (ECF subfamily)